MKRSTRFLITSAALTAIALPGCSKPDANDAMRETFATGVQGFLADGHDRLCLGLHDWPVDLTEAEAGARSRRAVQLPVFEQLGLTKSTLVPVPKTAENPDGAIKRYELTDEGRKYFRPHAVAGNGDAPSNDVCVARLSVARVESWELDTHDAQHPTAVVNYSYHVESAPWMSDPDAQRVLPMVAKVIQGADGGLQLHQRFAKGDHGWVAVAGAV